MNKEDLVSIVIATYNRGYILPRAIESALKQTYKNIEIIIVDDGSTDNTEEIVEGFSEPRIIYIRHSENLGCSAAKNTGIKNSKGYFIAFLDSDDEYLPRKIAKSVEAFKNSSPRLGIVASNYYKGNKNDRNIAVGKTYKIKRLSLISSWVIRRDVFEKIGIFDERLILSQDIDFMIRFRKKLSFCFIEEPLQIIHQSKDSAFYDKRKTIGIRKKYLLNLKNDPELYSRHLNYLGKDFCCLGQFKEARECFLKAFMAYPVNFKYFIKFLKYLPKNSGGS
jgi:glycosyltransferase involved in cell wall biosynthesis